MIANQSRRTRFLLHDSPTYYFRNLRIKCVYREILTLKYKQSLIFRPHIHKRPKTGSSEDDNVPTLELVISTFLVHFLSGQQKLMKTQKRVGGNVPKCAKGDLKFCINEIALRFVHLVCHWLSQYRLIWFPVK